MPSILTFVSTYLNWNEKLYTQEIKLIDVRPVKTFQNFTIHEQWRYLEWHEYNGGLMRPEYMSFRSKTQGKEIVMEERKFSLTVHML